MILTAHQPAYLPWLGYFEKISNSDIYVYMDSVQFERNSFTNRNKIKTPTGAIWLTVPVSRKDHLHGTILDLKIDNRSNWQRKHLNSIYVNYKKAPNFEICFPKLEKLYDKKYEFLSELCWEQLLFWLGELQIHTKVYKLSELEVHSKGSQLVFDLCRKFQVSEYISGALGKNYLEEEPFQSNGIHITYQNYQHPVYPQLWGDFLPYMGIVDLWMNELELNLFRKD